MPIININIAKYDKGTSFTSGDGSKSYKNYRVRAYNRDISGHDKIKAATGSIIGTTISLLLMMKKQGVKNPLKLKYSILH